MSRKTVISLFLLMCIMSTMIFSVAAEDTRLPVDDGMGSWHGGVTENRSIVYSYIWDHTVDDRAYSATVWVRNSFWEKKEKPGVTYGINEDGELRVEYTATINPFDKNKAGYKDFSVVNLKSRQVLKDTATPTSFEAEFDFGFEPSSVKK